jgi:hypothetical protein
MAHIEIALAEKNRNGAPAVDEEGAAEATPARKPRPRAQAKGKKSTKGKAPAQKFAGKKK